MSEICLEKAPFADTLFRNEVIALFKHLHSHGIIRRQVEYGGVSRRPEGNRKLAIVDFNHAGYIGRSERAVRSLNREMRYVKWYLHTLRPGQYVFASGASSA